MLSQDLSWLNDYSFAELEQIRKAIVERQMAKANDFVEEVKRTVTANQTIIEEIDNQIKYIDNVGLSNTYKDVIREWRNWQHNIKELKQYNVNSETMLDSFRYFAKACGLDGSLSVEEKLNDWLKHFNDIVNGVQYNYPSQHNHYLSRQDLKRRITEWRKNNEQRILEIYNMLNENDCYLHKQMWTNEYWSTIYQKFTNAIILSGWSIGSAEILKRDSWKNLNNQQIIDQIEQRTEAMYNLCRMLIQQRQQPFYSGSNQDINNDYSRTTGDYRLYSRNY